MTKATSIIRKPTRERYCPIGKIPQRIPTGTVLCHNHVTHDADTKCGVNGFRAWFAPTVPARFIPCDCGWSGLPHFHLGTVTTMPKPTLKVRAPLPHHPEAEGQDLGYFEVDWCERWEEWVSLGEGRGDAMGREILLGFSGPDEVALLIEVLQDVVDQMHRNIL